MRPISRSIMPCVLAAIAGGATAGPTMPNEFESPDVALGPLFAYFGGVTSWGTTPSSEHIHSGQSLEVWATLQNDIFTVAGFAVGTFGVSPPALNVDPQADTFSLTVRSPQQGVVSVRIMLREDDNGDNVIDINGADDEWESATYLLNPGTSAYNIPLSSLVDSNPGDGNDVLNPASTNRLAYLLVFESRDSYPGGQIVGPVSLWIDHVGLFDGPQTIPTPAVCVGDCVPEGGDGEVSIADVLSVVTGFGSETETCDFVPANPDGSFGDGVISVADVLAVVTNFGPCGN